jgi:hypothetical protein
MAGVAARSLKASCDNATPKTPKGGWGGGMEGGPTGEDTCATGAVLPRPFPHLTSFYSLESAQGS